VTNEENQAGGEGASDGGLVDLDFGHDVLYGSYTHLDHLQLEHFSVDSITGSFSISQGSRLTK
jgi:hypothetical protein